MAAGKQDARIDHKVIEMVADATRHIEAANVRTKNAENAARAAEQQTDEKLAYMQRVLQEGMMKTQMEAQAAIEQQKRDAEHQLQKVRDETELKL